MSSGELRRAFHDLGQLHARLSLPVNRRLRAEFGLSVSKLVDRLEARGLCCRIPNPHDRRSSLVELTAAGSRLCAGAVLAVEDELRWLLAAAPFPAAEVSELARALRALRLAQPPFGPD
jgi:MarR family transcriptional regulator, organic hydroperoxide resistance regulator